jgi:hypothetical protein
MTLNCWLKTIFKLLFINREFSPIILACMYTVLKTKRFHLEIPEDKIDQERLKNGEKQVIRRNGHSGDMIVNSCFMDDVFVLFLFNSGRYFIVKTSSA